MNIVSTKPHFEIDKLTKIAQVIYDKYQVRDIDGELRLTVFDDYYKDEKPNCEQVVTDSTIHTMAFLSMCITDLVKEHQRKHKTPGV